MVRFPDYTLEKLGWPVDHGVYKNSIKGSQSFLKCSINTFASILLKGLRWKKAETNPHPNSSKEQFSWAAPVQTFSNIVLGKEKHNLGTWMNGNGNYTADLQSKWKTMEWKISQVRKRASTVLMIRQTFPDVKINFIPKLPSLFIYKAIKFYLSPVHLPHKMPLSCLLSATTQNVIG